MHKATAYAVLARELERWRLLSTQELVASIGKPARVRSIDIDGEHIAIEVSARWHNEEGGSVLVTGVANGPSHWRLERVEESIVVPSVLQATLPQVVHGDITRLEVDAIVNAANEWMLGGGGVDGAIHAAAGPELLEACRAIPEVKPGIRCPVGEARITPAFRLAAKHIIHTVGPRWRGGARQEAEQLASCYESCLALAREHQLKSIAFPAISTGAFAYPLLAACRIAVAECMAFLASESAETAIVLVGFSKEDVLALRKALAEAELWAARGK
jgi:O-acetyl-ADP-ribose deacetylase (regulator of RNase III)